MSNEIDKTPKSLSNIIEEFSSKENLASFHRNFEGEKKKNSVQNMKQQKFIKYNNNKSLEEVSSINIGPLKQNLLNN